jgi:hypothetical protein
MDEGRRRVIGIMAAIFASLHMQAADDLFGTPQGRLRTDKLIDASIQWGDRIMKRIDTVFGRVEEVGRPEINPSKVSRVSPIYCATLVFAKYDSQAVAGRYRQPASTPSTAANLLSRKPKWK